MAFVSRAERNMDTRKTFGEKNPVTAPGTYDQDHSKTALKRQAISAKSPFEAQTNRKQANASDYNSVERTHGGLNYNPGPGHYKVSEGFGKTMKQVQSAQTLNYYNVDTQGHQAEITKPTGNFTSKVQRFVFTSNKRSNSSTPGPGFYETRLDMLHTKKRNLQSSTSQTIKGQKLSKSNQLDGAKRVNAPSIPSHDNIYGYEMSRTGDLVRQKNTEQIYSGNKDDMVGPGEYYHKLPKRNDKITKWHKPVEPSQKSKLIMQQRQGQNPGPGHYDPKKVKLLSEMDGQKNQNHNVASAKMSSNFDSNVNRLSDGRYMTSIRQQESSNRNNKLQNKMWNTDFDFRDGRGSTAKTLEAQLSDDENVTPGPGSYIGNTLKMPSQKPDQFQFFGSTVERFADHPMNSLDVAMKGNIGPGTYKDDKINSIQTSTKPKIPKGKNSKEFQRYVGFQSCNVRFDDTLRLKQSLTPGPCSYVQQTKENCLAQKLEKQATANKVQGAFGSSEKRFVPKNSIIPPSSVPGPGHYNGKKDSEFILEDDLTTQDNFNPMMRTSQSTKHLKKQSMSSDFQIKSHFTGTRGQSKQNSRNQNDKKYKTNSVFASKSIRPANQTLKRRDTIQASEILGYDNQQGTISSKLNQKAIKDNYSTVSKVEQTKKKATHGFSSNVPRFTYTSKSNKRLKFSNKDEILYDNDDDDDASKYLGPGYYDQKDGLQTDMDSKNRKVRNQQANFLSQSGRFQHYESKMKKVAGIPGPGSYNKLQAKTWNKRSYNQLFIQQQTQLDPTDNQQAVFY